MKIRTRNQPDIDDFFVRAVTRHRQSHDSGRVFDRQLVNQAPLEYQGLVEYSLGHGFSHEERKVPLQSPVQALTIRHVVVIEALRVKYPEIRLQL